METPQRLLSQHPQTPECPRLSWHIATRDGMGPGAAAAGAQAWMGTLSCTTEGIRRGPNVCGTCGEGHSVSGGAGAPKGRHRYTGVCRGVM